MHVLCFENGAACSLTDVVGLNWVVLDGAFPAFMELDWFRAVFLDANREAGRLAYPRRGETPYQVLSRDDVVRLAAGLQPLLDDPATAAEVRSAAEGLARLASEALSRDALTLAHTSLL